MADWDNTVFFIEPKTIHTVYCCANGYLHLYKVTIKLYLCTSTDTKQMIGYRKGYRIVFEIGKNKQIKKSKERSK